MGSSPVAGVVSREFMELVVEKVVGRSAVGGESREGGVDELGIGSLGFHTEFNAPFRYAIEMNLELYVNKSSNRAVSSRASRLRITLPTFPARSSIIQCPYKSP